MPEATIISGIEIDFPSVRIFWVKLLIPLGVTQKKNSDQSREPLLPV